MGWVIVLLGAQVAYAHQHIHFFEGEREVLAYSPAGREKLALEMMSLVGRNFHNGVDPMNVSELATELRIPAGMVKDFMEMFHQTRLVLPLADGETFVLARDPETISIKEILDCVKNSGRKTKKQLSNRTKGENQIDALLLDVDHSVTDALEGKSLQSLSLGQGHAPRRKGLE